MTRGKVLFVALLYYMKWKDEICMNNDKYLVQIYSGNEDHEKVYIKEIECKGIIEVSRTLITFEPKKGFSVYKYDIRLIDLVLDI